MARKCPHCGARHPSGTQRCTATGRPIEGDTELVGRVVAGRYHLVRLLGDGGMGAVYKAADQVLRRFVAIKLLHATVAENPSSVERFQREARAAAAIGHPNIIDIIDFGREGTRPYMVMEYVRGRSLSQVIAMDGQLDIKRAVTIAVHTLAGLQAAHDRGILHRDLKPANLMLVARFGDRNFVKVCDFGFAALLGAGSSEAKALTPERTLVGTPAYAAPERLRGDDRRDPRLDVYSVGVVLYEMLAGRRPFDAPTFRELARKVRKEEPESLRSKRDDMPQLLERVIMKSLEKERDNRWESADAFAEALLPFGYLAAAFRDEQPSDSFTMEMMRIKARDTRVREPAFERRAPPPLPASGDADATQRLSAEAALRMVEELDQEARDRVPSSLDVPIEIGEPHSPPPVDQEKTAVGAKAFPDDPPRPARERSDPTVLARPSGRRRPITESEPSDGSRYYSGRLVLAILRFVARKFGERSLKDVLESMPPDSRAPFDAGIAEESWVALDAVRTLVERIDARLGKDDLHLVLETGRAAAEGAFDLMEALGPPGPSPELLVAEMPSIMHRVVRGIHCEVRRVGRGYGRLELLEDEEPSLTLAVSTLGFLARSLERFGADDVEVNLLSARALEDDQTLIDISWFA